MTNRLEAAQVSPLLYMLLTFLLVFIIGTVSVNAETKTTDEKSKPENQSTQPLLRNYLNTPETESEYPLFPVTPRALLPCA